MPPKTPFPPAKHRHGYRYSSFDHVKTRSESHSPSLPFLAQPGRKDGDIIYKLALMRPHDIPSPSTVLLHHSLGGRALFSSSCFLFDRRAGEGFLCFLDEGVLFGRGRLGFFGGRGGFGVSDGVGGAGGGVGVGG